MNTQANNHNEVQRRQLGLNEKLNARNLMVRVSPLAAEFFNLNFVGRSYRLDFGWGMDSKYEAVYIRDS